MIVVVVMTVPPLRLHHMLPARLQTSNEAQVRLRTSLLAQILSEAVSENCLIQFHYFTTSSYVRVRVGVGLIALRWC